MYYISTLLYHVSIYKFDFSIIYRMSEDFKNLSKYIKDNYPSIGAFESRNSIPKNNVRRLFDRKTENTTIKTLVQIADTLGCTVDEVLDRNKHITSEKSFFDNYNYEKELSCLVLEYVATAIKNSKIPKKINKKELFEAINQILLYCIEKNGEKFDSKVASWILEHSLFRKQ